MFPQLYHQFSSFWKFLSDLYLKTIEEKYLYGQIQRWCVLIWSRTNWSGWLWVAVLTPTGVPDVFLIFCVWPQEDWAAWGVSVGWRTVLPQQFSLRGDNFTSSLTPAFRHLKGFTKHILLRWPFMFDPFIFKCKFICKWSKGQNGHLIELYKTEWNRQFTGLDIFLLHCNLFRNQVWQE